MHDSRPTRTSGTPYEGVVELTVNGQQHKRTVPTRKTLADFLREDLGLTGTHLGCEHGVCGACTVLVDGEAVRSCIMLAVQVDGTDVTTIEGVGGDGGLHPVQQAFIDHHGLQCGFCTPGMVLSAIEVIARCPDLSEETVRTELGGNLCRCTGYEFIVDAVLAAAKKMQQGRPGPTGEAR